MIVWVIYLQIRVLLQGVILGTFEGGTSKNTLYLPHGVVKEWRHDR